MFFRTASRRQWGSGGRPEAFVCRLSKAKTKKSPGLCRTIHLKQLPRTMKDLLQINSSDHLDQKCYRNMMGFRKFQRGTEAQ